MEDAESAEENVEVQLDLKKIIPLSLNLSEMLQDLNGVEQVFMVSAGILARQVGLSAEFIGAVASMLPYTQQFLSQVKVKENV